tara:strand:+ start:1932 stop:2840 length:909 start_codon:yes stop_codon:yes gene_type:complete
MNINNNDKKILSLLYENREGIRYTSIMKWANLKQSVVYKRLSLLRKKGILEHEFPLWKISNGQVDFCRRLLKNDNIFELHNVAYVIKLVDVPKWWHTRKNRLLRLKGYQFKSVDWGKNASNPYIQLSNDKFVIQTYPESIIIMHRKRYYSNNPYDTAIQFLQDFYDLWEWFEERMKFKFFKEEIPQMTLRGHDFNRLNDYIANKIKEDKSKFLVELDKNRKVWVDLSEPFGKEANYPHAQEILEKHTKDLLLNKPMMNSELQLMVQGIAENQVMFAKNIESHMNVLREMSTTLKKIQKSLNK